MIAEIFFGEFISLFFDRRTFMAVFLCYLIDKACRGLPQSVIESISLTLQDMAVFVHKHEVIGRIDIPAVNQISHRHAAMFCNFGRTKLQVGQYGPAIIGNLIDIATDVSAVRKIISDKLLEPFPRRAAEPL